MSKMQRNKGQRGERELFGLLSEHLGTCVRRNVDQAREGGADGIEVHLWAIEVKRHESGFRSEWWDQTLQQAAAHGRYPALAYRASRQPWRVRIWLECINDNYRGGNWVETDVQTFAMIVREGMSD